MYINMIRQKCSDISVNIGNEMISSEVMYIKLLVFLLFASSETVTLRDKEKVHDYRFMPEPNLPPLHIYTDDSLPARGTDGDQVINVDSLRRSLPELPTAHRNRLHTQHGLNMEDCLALVVSLRLILINMQTIIHLLDVFVQIVFHKNILTEQTTMNHVNTVKPILREHCHETPPVLKDKIYRTEGATHILM